LLWRPICRVSQFHGNVFTERSLTTRFLVRPKAALRAALDAAAAQTENNPTNEAPPQPLAHLGMVAFPQFHGNGFTERAMLTPLRTAARQINPQRVAPRDINCTDPTGRSV
jgi:hypothetical protein